MNYYPYPLHAIANTLHAGWSVLGLLAWFVQVPLAKNRIKLNPWLELAAALGVLDEFSSLQVLTLRVHIS